MNGNNISTSVLVAACTGYDIAVAEPHTVTGVEPEILGRRDLLKVLPLNPQFPRKGNFPFSGGFIFGIVHRFDFFNPAAGPVVDDEFQGL
jgi:hypothetical protein